jgi:hypothetical protein
MNTQDWINATPEQINFWKQAQARLAGWNTITSLHYQGLIAGSNFLLYAATKLYIALELEFSIAPPATVLDIPSANLYDETNTVCYYIQSSGIVYDGGAPGLAWSNVNREYHNLFFSRIVVARYTYIRFNGYVLTVV